MLIAVNITASSTGTKVVLSAVLIFLCSVIMIIDPDVAPNVVLSLVLNGVFDLSRGN